MSLTIQCARTFGDQEVMAAGSTSSRKRRAPCLPFSRPKTAKRSAASDWPTCCGRTRGRSKAATACAIACWSCARRCGRGAASDLAADFANCRIEDTIVDLDDFERLSRSQDPRELQTAADLYRGDFLADFYIASEPFQEWLAAERDRTLAVVCDVLHRLIALQDAAGDHEAAIQSGRRLVTLEPLSEFRAARADARLRARRTPR